MSPRDKDRRRIGGRVIGGAVAGGGILLISIGALISIIGGGSDIPSVGAGVLRLDLFAARDIGTMPARDSWCSVSRTAEHCWTLQETTGDATDYGSGSWHLTPTGTRRGVVTSVPTASASNWADYTSELAVWGDGAAASGLFEAGATPSATNVLSVTMIAKPVLDGVLGVLVSHQSTSPPNTGWYIYMSTAGAITGVVDYGPGVVNVSSTINAREAWQCVTVVLDARTANQGKIYANGADVTVGAGNLVAAVGGFTAVAPFRIHGNQNSSAFASVHGVARVRLDEGHVTTLAEHQAHCGALWQAPAGGQSNNKPLAADANWTQTGGAGCWPTGATSAVCVPGGLQPYTVDATAAGWPVQEAITNPLLYSTKMDCTNWSCVGSASGTPGQVAPDGSATASLITVASGANHFEQDVTGGWTADASPLYFGLWAKCSTGTVDLHGDNTGARGEASIDCSCVGGSWRYVWGGTNGDSDACVTVSTPFNADSSGNSGFHFEGVTTPVSVTAWAPTLTEQRPWTRVVIPTWSSSVTLGDPVWSIDNGLANTGSQLLADNDCEDSGTSAWTPINNPTLTKETGDPHGGLRSLRIAYNGTQNPYVRQSILTVGKIYRCTGWAKGDGSVPPYVYCGTGSASWVGTSSTSWQYYDVIKVAVSSIVIYQAVTSSAGYIEIDDMTVHEQKPFGGYYRAGDTVIQSLTQYNGTCWNPGPFDDGKILLSGSPACSGTWYGLQVRK